MTTMYGRFEANFSITTSATNVYASYDPSPPLSNYYSPGVGVTVDALFLPPGVTDWASAIVQPCFYYQPVALALVGGVQQGIVTGTSTWKVRFQPKQTGSWQVRIRVIDANGTTLMAPSSFTVSAATAGSHGCLRVATAESSVFEFEDGTPYFPVGHNGGNASSLPSVLTNNVNLERIWLSNYRLFATGHGDNSAPWFYLNITDFDHFFQPLSAGAPSKFGVRLLGGANTSAINSAASSSCATDALLSCKRNTQYRWSTWVNTSGLSGTGVFTVKLGPYASAGTVTSVLSGITDGRRIITTTAGAAPTTWTQYTGTYTTGAGEDFFGGASNPYLYLALEGSTTGYVEFTIPVVQEVLAGPTYGPNQLDLATGAMDQYSQLGSAMVDSLVADAESKGIYLKLVTQDKGDVGWRYLNADGTLSTTSLLAGSIYNDLNTTQSGRLHKDYFRYLTARWGYSSAIHSWEHVNEGDGGTAQQKFTDQLAVYLKSIDPNKHMVSTSTYAGVRSTFWAGMPNVDYDDFHAYNDTGDLKTKDWQLPQIDNAGSAFWTQPSAGVIRMDCSKTPHDWSLPFVCQEAGTWSVSADIDPSAVTGGTFGVTGEGMSLLLAAGAARTVLSGTFTPTLTGGIYTANLLLGDGTRTGGLGDLRNLTITTPSGKRLVTLVGDGTFPLQTDISLDTAAFHTAYDSYATYRPTAGNRAGQGVRNRPQIQGEWSPGLGNSNAYTAGITSDTNLVWLHTSQFARLGPGNLHDLYWILAANDLVTANNGWGKYGQFLSFAGALPLNNGHYVDIAATPSGQTNGTVVAVGQKDTTNNRAHMWVRHKQFTWSNAVNAPTAWLPGGVAGQILTGTVSFSGLANGTYTATINEFNSSGALSTSTQSVTVAGGSGSINLAALASTTTDAAVSLAPVTGTQYVFIRM